MSLIKSKFPEHTDRQLDTDKNLLPEGTIITGNQAVISDKSLALAIYDNDCAVFVAGENGRLQLLTDRDDVVNHSGTYFVSSSDLMPVLELERKLEQEKPQEKSESEVLKEKQELALSEISALTGVSLSQLQALPDDIKEDVLAVIFFMIVPFYSPMANYANLRSCYIKTPIRDFLFFPLASLYHTVHSITIYIIAKHCICFLCKL